MITFFRLFSNLFKFLSSPEYGDYEEDYYVSKPTTKTPLSRLSELLPKVEQSYLKNTIDDVESAQRHKFSVDLYRELRQRDLRNKDCYARACMDKASFSRIIKSGSAYHPTKETLIAFAFAMRMTLEETERFLNHAGYALTNRYALDLVATMLIQNRIYDVQVLDECLLILGEEGILTKKNRRTYKKR